jgi:GAF domain-containing protein/CheY-like chemotaxis protein
MTGSKPSSKPKTARSKSPAKKSAAPKPPAKRTVAALKGLLAERESELAILNSVGEAMARQLDLESITRNIGDKVRDIFQTEVASIFFFDEARQQVEMVYSYDRGYVSLPPPLPLGKGLSSRVILSRQPLVIGTSEEADALQSVNLPNAAGETDLAQSWLGVPIIVSDKVIGLVSVEDYKKNAYNESSVRLLSTLASNMGVAIQNARLFDETRRLLKETEERNAELAIINNVQEALVAELDIQAMYEMIGEKVRSIFDAQVVLIATFNHSAGVENFHFVFEKGEMFHVPPRPMDVMRRYLVKTRQPLLINENFPQRVAELGGRPNVVPGTELPKSLLFVPLIVGKEVNGYISLQNIDRERAFRESDVRLLSTLANSMSVALESARLFNETQRLFKAEQQRAAELAVISSIQQGLAAELNFQAIIDLVGDKLREVLNTGDVGIRWYEEKTHTIHYLYEYEHGKRIAIPSAPPVSNLWSRMVETRQPLVFNTRAEMESFGIQLVPGTDQSYCLVTVPIIGRDRVIGSIIIENYERENAYSESEVRLLQTVASSMGVALENARLFDETQRLFKAEQQRTSELQIINSVQEVLASKLDEQEIYNLVGDRIANLFDAQTLYIMIFDAQNDMEYYPFMVERGKRQYQEPMPHDENGFSPLVMRTRKPVMINESMAERSAEVGSIILADGEISKSGIWVPIIIRDHVRGVISAQNIDREHAFTESDISLLTTIANSMGVALENARLFEETQRLLKETAQRAEELQIVNRVQALLDSRLNPQSIYDMVGDKIRDIFDAQTVVLSIYDKENNLTHYPYIIENGARLSQSPLPLEEGGGGFGGHVIRTRRPLVVNRNFEEESIKYRSHNLGDNQTKDVVVRSGVWVPLLVGDEVKGVLSLQNLEREDAFSNSDVRLLITLANSMSAALENVRLFNETQRLLKETEQRASELTIINRVLAGLDSRGDIQAMYDLVGNKINEIFATHTTVLMVYDRKANQLIFPYIMERGVRLHQDPIPFPETGGGFSAHVIRAGQPMMVNENFAEEARKYQSVLMGESKDKGIAVKSGVWVPLMVGDEARGVISLQNLEREHAFKESDVRLLSTLANSLGITLENARLFDETQRLLKETEQRASELAIINSVQKSLVSKLDLQAIIELVGEKIWQIFDSQVVVISLYSSRDRTIEHRYILERGERIYLDHPLPVDPMREHVIKMRQSWLINENFRQAAEELGTSYKIVGEEPKSLLFVPLIVGQEVTGVVSLQNLDHEHAFAASDAHLLQTIANGMSVAIENARLFDETQRLFHAERQAHEQAETLRSIAHALNASLSLSDVFNLVLTEIQKVIPYDSAAIFEVQNNRRTFVAGRGFENLDELLGLKFEFNPQDDEIGYRVSRTLQPLILDDATATYPQYFGVGPHARAEIRSYMGVPIIFNNEMIGMITLAKREEKFYHEEYGKLALAFGAQAATALNNARLFEEANRRARETAVLNEVGRDVSSTLELSAVMDKIATHARDLLSASTSAIYLPDKEGRTFRAIAAKGKIAEEIMADTVHSGEGIIGTLAQQGRGEFINDTNADPRTVQIPGTAMVSEERLMVTPLLTAQKVIGMMAVWREGGAPFNQADFGFLEELSLQAAIAIKNANYVNQVKQRVAELDILNSASEAMSKVLDVKTVTRIIGDKVRDIFTADSVIITLLDHPTQLIHHYYVYDKKEGGYIDYLKPFPLGTGITSRVIQTRMPLNLGTLEEQTANGGYVAPELFENAKGVQYTQSWMGVPIIVGDKVVGVVNVQSYKEHAYTEDDQRLLQTLSANMGVAIENARLFDETQRLLKETEQRNAELQIINGIGQVLTRQHDLATVIDLVGDKLREIVGEDNVGIGLYDPKTRVVTTQYVYKKDERLQTPSFVMNDFTLKAAMQGKSLVFNKFSPRLWARLGPQMSVDGQIPKSAVMVPLVVGKTLVGGISVQTFDRENAYSESFVKLLEAIASNMATSIQNARLFEETKQRAAELAVVNTVSNALAGALDLNTVIELVGEQIRSAFHADIAYVALLDDARQTIHFPYQYGEELSSIALGRGLVSKVIEGKQSILINRDIEKRRVELGVTFAGQRRARAYLGVPIFLGGEAIGILSVQSEKQENAFTENDQRLLETIAANVGVAIQNARLFEEAEQARRAAEEANHAKSAFLANMSHELRTPLNAIVGFTRIVRRKAEGALPEKQLDNLDKVLTSSEHLLNLINTVLDIAKIEAGRMEVQASNFSIEALSEQCLTTAQPLIKPGVRLERDFAPIATIIHSDQDKIKQIILNLLSNAAKFTQTGYVRLSIRSNPTHLTLAVSDTGIGINKEALDRIFEEFQQADTSTTRKYGGTGLGLSISRSLARLLGGELTAVSEPGQGATFTLTIPIHYGDANAASRDPARGQTKEADASPQPAGQPRKLVLVIDDDPDAVYLLQESLSPAYEIVGARTGMEGQQKARELHPRAILLDIMMPDKDGWQVLHDLKQDPHTRGIPVILLTIVDKKALGFRLGASAYLLKPLDPEAVMDALQRVTQQEGRPARHVLVVDDDPLVADMLRQILPEKDFALESALDGMAGLEAIAHRRPDVILLDLMMPRLDGFSVIQQLRQNPGTQDLPIIVISAKELTAEESTRLKESAAYVMRKQGFDSERLLREINKALETNK